MGVLKHPEHPPGYATVQDCCNRSNWGAQDHASRAPPVTAIHVCFFTVVTRRACTRVFIILIILLHTCRICQQCLQGKGVHKSSLGTSTSIIGSK